MQRSCSKLTFGLIAGFALSAFICGFPAGANGVDTEEVLGRWASSLGGRERLEAAKTIQVRTSVKMFGLDGMISEWSAADGRHHEILDLGGLFHVETVFDGTSGWQLDQNGKVSQLSGADLRREITSAYISSWSHLLEGRLAGSAEYLGVEEDTGLHIVRFHPQSADSITFYLDGERYLPVRAEQPSDERRLTTTYAEWDSVEGILFPAAFSHSTGDPQYDTSGRLVEVLLDPTPPEEIFKKPEEAADDFQFTEGTSARGIPIELNTVHIFVQARVNGSDPLWFVLDTGASVTALNTATAGDLGMDLAGKIEGRGSGEGSVEVNLVSDVCFDLPGVKLFGQTVATAPLAHIEKLMGRPIDGIFGYDFISRFVMEIDYEGLKLHLYDRNSYEYDGDGSVVPMTLEDNSPRIDVVVTPQGREPIPGNLLVDTGASLGVAFALPFVERNDLLSSLPKKFLFEGGYGIGGASKSYVGRISRIEIGGLSFESPVCRFTTDKWGSGGDPNRAGALGGEILSRCTVIFDYERERMILEPNSSFGLPFYPDMSGITWTTGGRGDFSTFRILRLVQGSPAAEAGLQADDRLVSVDAIPASEFTIHTLQEYLRRDGREVRLTVQREGEEISRTLTLKPLI